MSEVLAVVGWLAWLVFGGYLAVAGFGVALVSGALRGRVSRHALAAGLVGLVVLAAAFRFAPFHLAWGRA